MKESRPKQVKNDNGVYVDTAEMREVNSIQKVFHPENHKTIAECKAKSDTAKFYQDWLEKNKGQVRTIASKAPGANTANQSANVSSLFA